MNLNKFQELSKRTMPFKGEPKNNIEFENMLGNYALGLIGEVVEAFEVYKNLIDFDYSSLINELGDISHYAVGIAELFKLQLPEHIEENKTDTDFLFEELLYRAKYVSEYAKKRIYHRHDEAFDYKMFLEIFSLLKAISKKFGCKYSDTLQMNIDKLKTRYPESFNVEDSKKRVDVS